MSPASRPSAPPAGMQVGGYRLVSRLGEGGMGVVHLAQRRGGPQVALKVLRPHVVGDDEGRQRLAQEVSSLSRLHSDRVAEIVDADPWGPVPYVATRYVPGPDLTEYVAGLGPLAGDDLLDLGLHLAEALDDVHRVGLLHRDVKPSNVLMEDHRPVLIDFGLARLAEDPRLTQTGFLLGTPGYLAPEILAGEDASPASDVYSWAATVAFAGTGRAPFGRGQVLAIMDRVRRGDHDLDGLDEEVLPLVLGALDPDPDRRPELPEVLEWLDDGSRPEPTRLARRPEPVTEHLPQPTAYLPEEQEPPRPPLAVRARAAGTVLALGGAATAGVVAAPWPALAGLVVLVWLVRTLARAGAASLERRRYRGSRWYDSVQTLVSTPYHLLAAVPGTLALSAWACGMAVAAGLVCYTFAAGEDTTVAAMAVTLVAGLWLGPGSSRVRRPLRGSSRRLAGHLVAWGLVTLLLCGACGFVLSGWLAEGTSWTPWSQPPWEAVPTLGIG